VLVEILHEWGRYVYLSERKVRFYERSHDRKADRMIVISPMIDEKARQAAKELGIETYSDSLEVENLGSW